MKKLYIIILALFCIAWQGNAQSSFNVYQGDVVLKNGEVIGVGVAMMSGREMADLKRGIAVKIRHKAKQ